MCPKNVLINTRLVDSAQLLIWYLLVDYWNIRSPDILDDTGYFRQDDFSYSIFNRTWRDTGIYILKHRPQAAFQKVFRLYSPWFILLGHGMPYPYIPIFPV